MTKTYDAIIVGGGPAGASCALWLKMFGYQPYLLEKSAKLGGLQNQSPYINDWIATTHDHTGEEVAHSIHTNIMLHKIDCALESSVHNIQRLDTANGFIVQFKDSAYNLHKVISRFIVLACGVRPVHANL